MRQPHVDARPEQMGCAVLLLRLAWSVGGHFALLSFGLLVVREARFSGWDVAFWLTIPAIALVRRWDIARFGPLESSDPGAALAEWRRHLRLLVLAGGGLWAAYHAIRLWLTS